MAKSVFLVLPAIAIAVAACSGSTSGSTVTADQGCTDLGGSICDKIAACSAPLLQLVYGDAATCKTRFKLTCPSTISAPGSGATGANLEACAQAYTTAACADLFSGNQPAPCNVHGSLMAGAACANNIQCSGDHGYCNTASGQTCGVCGTRAAAGATCAKSADCDTGLVCGFGTGMTTGACVTPGAAGATCDAPHPCAGALSCVGGTCAQSAAAGAACDPTASNCDSTQGLFCHPINKVCASAQFAKAGEACGFMLATGTYAACSGNGRCTMPAGSLTGTCEAPAADGAMCDTTNGPTCLAPAVCTNGACKVPDASACK
jgi:hypothetical protein